MHNRLTIEQVVYTLLNRSGLTKYRLFNRVYPLKLPQNPIYPSITYQISDLNPTYSMDGYSKLNEKTIIFMIYSKSYEEVVDLSNRLNLVLNNLKERFFVSYIRNYFYIDMLNNKIYFASIIDNVRGDSAVVYRANKEGARLGRPLKDKHEYFLIKKENSAYQLAETYEKALSDDPIILLDEGLVAISYANLSPNLNILGSFLIDENRAFDFDLNVYSIAQTITFHFND